MKSRRMGYDVVAGVGGSGRTKSLEQRHKEGVFMAMMSKAEERVLHVLTGCTAVGKTELALQWAELNDAEIISCDSLLFYRGMDIGTAKPSREELRRVPHHLVDTCALGDQMDVSRYVVEARACAEALQARGRKILVVGGSGFYLKAFFSPVADEVLVSPSLRERIRGLDLPAALAELEALNPAGLGALDRANPRRVFRALERCLASGRTLAELAEAFARQPSAFADWQVKLLRLEREPSDLEQRIERRVRSMLDAGLVSEVRRLFSCGLLANPSAAKAIGYREVVAHLAGELSEELLLPEIVGNTRALVKKQRTWFRTQIPQHACVHPERISAAALFS